MDNLVFSNMMHRPARTVVSVLGIGVGILLIVFTYGLANGSLRGQAKMDGNVGAEIIFCAEGSICVKGTESFRLPVSLAKDLENIEGVKLAVPVGQTTVNAPDTNLGKRLVDGINFDEYAGITGIHIIEGRTFAPKSDEAIIDTAWQKQKKVKVGDTINLWDRDFKVVGTYEPAGGARVKVPLATMQNQVIGTDSSPEELNKVSTVLIKIKDGFTEDQVGNNILNTYPNYQLIRTKDLEELYLNSYPALNVFLNVVIGVAATISALVILLTMYTTVTERTRQIGILKSLGMSNSKIAWIIAQEALLISFFGILTGIIITVILRFVLMQFTTLNVELKPLVLLFTLIVGLIGGAIGALYPALRAARLDAVEALSYE